MKNFEQKALIITGPTAAGKTALAEEIANRVPGDIVNIDLGQMYTPLTIGTAKPSWRDSTIPHHLFDILIEPRNVTVVEYREKLISLLPSIWQQGRLPIIVGGSAFYVQSLIFPPKVATGHNISEQLKNKSTESLWGQLASIDPKRAHEINCRDRYRIIRALTIWFQTGQKPSLVAPEFSPPTNLYMIIATRDRQDLYKRIDDRTRTMIEEGWIDEVRALGPDWRAFLKEKKIIGYNDIIYFLEETNQDERAREQLIKIIQQKTRAYAKRQTTFFNQLAKKIERAQAVSQRYTVTVSWLNLSTDRLDLSIKELSATLTSM